MVRFLMLMVMAFQSQLLSAAPIESMNKVGEGQMSYLFWDVYKAALYSESSRYQSLDSSYPLALQIHYLRDIDSDVLIQATQEQWQHLAYSDEQISRWSEPLNALWPDIQEGDVLTIIVDEQGISDFYHGDEALGTVTNANFGPAFLSIWLSENTTEPELRQALLGAVQ
ncbi:chalcone isomerase family protein [Shewanella waksmanii]|uniref:chalcone isomerase family protein n=1 Tax=Shewanella waksmanii TaxID=213783 RepID=UPI003735ADD0